MIRKGRPKGIEPSFSAPQADVLTIELRSPQKSSPPVASLLFTGAGSGRAFRGNGNCVALLSRASSAAERDHRRMAITIATAQGAMVTAGIHARGGDKHSSGVLSPAVSPGRSRMLKATTKNVIFGNNQIKGSVPRVIWQQGQHEGRGEKTNSSTRRRKARQETVIVAAAVTEAVTLL